MLFTSTAFMALTGTTVVSSMAIPVPVIGHVPVAPPRPYAKVASSGSAPGIGNGAGGRYGQSTTGSAGSGISKTGSTKSPIEIGLHPGHFRRLSPAAAATGPSKGGDLGKRSPGVYTSDLNDAGGEDLFWVNVKIFGKDFKMAIVINSADTWVLSVDPKLEPPRQALKPKVDKVDPGHTFYKLLFAKHYDSYSKAVMGKGPQPGYHPTGSFTAQFRTLKVEGLVTQDSFKISAFSLRSYPFGAATDLPKGAEVTEKLPVDGVLGLGLSRIGGKHVTPFTKQFPGPETEQPTILDDAVKEKILDEAVFTLDLWREENAPDHKPKLILGQCLCDHPPETTQPTKGKAATKGKDSAGASSSAAPSSIVNTVLVPKAEIKSNPFGQWTIPSSLGADTILSSTDRHILLPRNQAAKVTAYYAKLTKGGAQVSTNPLPGVPQGHYWWYCSTFTRPLPDFVFQFGSNNVRILGSQMISRRGRVHAKHTSIKEQEVCVGSLQLTEDQHATIGLPFFYSYTTCFDHGVWVTNYDPSKEPVQTTETPGPSGKYGTKPKVTLCNKFAEEEPKGLASRPDLPADQTKAWGADYEPVDPSTIQSPLAEEIPGGGAASASSKKKKKKKGKAGAASAAEVPLSAPEAESQSGSPQAGPTSSSTQKPGSPPATGLSSSSAATSQSAKQGPERPSLFNMAGAERLPGRPAGQASRSASAGSPSSASSDGLLPPLERTESWDPERLPKEPKQGPGRSKSW